MKHVFYRFRTAVCLGFLSILSACSDTSSVSIDVDSGSFKLNCASGSEAVANEVGQQNENGQPVSVELVAKDGNCVAEVRG